MPKALSQSKLLRFFASCPRGLQEYLQAEVQRCEAGNIVTSAAGVGFSASLQSAYQLNLTSRIASRVLMQVGSGRYRVDRELYKIASRVNWEDHVSASQTIRVDIRAVRSHLRSLKIAALRVKDAVVDRLRDQTGARPNIDTRDPDVRIAVYLEDQQLSLYVDLSGPSLFMRGWRQTDDKGNAPIKENLASGLLMACQWTPDRTMFDPFCGSGTIAIEAAQMAGGLLPRLRGEYGLHRLQSFDSNAWQAAMAQADLTARAIAGKEQASIFAADISPRMCEIARNNCGQAGLADGMVRIRQQDFLDSNPPSTEPGFIVSNLPYGERINLVGKGDTYKDIGAHLRSKYSGWTVCLLSADLKLPGKLGLRERRKIPMVNGNLECRLFIFDMR